MAQPTLDINKTTLKTKTTYKLIVDGKSSGFVCKEKYKNGSIRWYPFRYFEGGLPPQQKYEKIKYIETEDGLIPKVGFSTTLESGYGFTRPQGVAQLFRYLETCIDKLSAVVFTKDRTELLDGVLYISRDDFGRLRARTKLFTDSTKREQLRVHRSILSKVLPEEFEEPGDIVFFEGQLAQFMSKFASDTIRLGKDDIESITTNFNVEPESIASTKRVVDRVYIEDVVGEFEKILKRKNKTKNLEETWQKFFNKHQWIFSNIFSYPAVFLKDKFNVSGHNISGGTDKIVHFLYKNNFTDNIAFIEIKTHKTKLMQESLYRKPDIYPVSKDLSGSMIQVIDQRLNFMKQHDPPTKGSKVRSLNSKCIVIAGSISDLKDDHQKRSFELFRLSNKDVEIVTFDELQNKMNTVLELFTK